MHSGLTIYLVFKTVLYTILLSRLWAAHNTFDYYPLQMKIWTVFVISWNISNICILNLTSESIYNGPDVFPKCNQITKVYALASVAGLDIVSGVINITLFTRPLFRAIKEVNDTEL